MIGTNQDRQILYSAITFRHLLDSLARPGKINQLTNPHFLLGMPASVTSSPLLSLNRYALGAMWTLLDREVTFSIAADGQWLAADHPIVQWITLSSGANMAAAEQATFAFFCDGRSYDLVQQLHVGTLLEPENSATVIYCVEQLAEKVNNGQEGEEEMRLELRGPGIEEQQRVSVWGLSENALATIHVARSSYPLGIDIYLIDAFGHCLGLPRTTQIQVGK